MQTKRSAFKRPSKKHEPKGLTILYEDQDILVVNKINGLLTIGTTGEREKTAHFLLNDYVKKGNSRSKNRVFIVHRLDRETSGVLVFAKNERVKRYLQDEWKSFSKTYFAVVHGQLDEKEGTITSYLTENSVHRVFSVEDEKKGKLSETAYKVIQATSKFSLLEINLLTGRKHQIRVHFSEKGHPVAGDKMYGKVEKGMKRLALHAASLTLQHPYTKEKMTFKTTAPTSFKTLLTH